MNQKKIGIPLEGFAEFSRRAAAEGAVLLKNDDMVLPIKSGENVSLFGRIQKNYYRSGTGSGGCVNVSYTTNLLDGLRSKKDIHVNEELAAVYENWLQDNPFDDGGGVWAGEPWNQKEMPLSTELVKSAREQSEKAIVVIGRTAGEDKDNADAPGSYRLTKEEEEMLKAVTGYFEQVAVVLNVSNIIDMSWMDSAGFKYPVKCVIYAWQGGMEGGNAIADVLAGEVTPSGKLTDTIAYSIEDYPSTKNYGGEIKNIYQEDIYVGYRYFETFCPEKVHFEFGCGLSYTDFSVTTLKAEKVRENNKDCIVLQVKVRNEGEIYSGKEVVEVYYEAPQGRLGRPVRALGAFGKTGLLKPKEEEILTIKMPAAVMAAYDDGGVTGNPFCYVLEAGEYRIYAGNSLRNAALVQIDGKDGYVLEKLAVTERLKQASAPVEDFTRMKPGKKKEDGSYEIAYEKVPKLTISMEERIKSNLPKEIKYAGDKGYHLKDVAENKVTMEEFLSQLSNEDLAALVRGEGMCHPLVTPGTASAFGGVTDRLLHFGIPLACTSDGPSGIRMDGGYKATQVPIGTLLAATWNTKLVEELYVMEGRELLSNSIDMLLGPGLNIRRSPLNGRNFEYFSEDPLITGKFAGAVVRGIMKGGSNATLKHFACNNQEKFRSKVDAVVSERALREIYLKGFEIAVKEGGANGIMTSYNPINGHWSASNYDLNTTILREEWGFQGIVMTDWWAIMNDVVSGSASGKPADRKNTHFMVKAQNDLYMVVSNFGAEVNAYRDLTEEALKEGILTRGELQRCAGNICEFIIKAPVFKREESFTEEAVFVAATSFDKDADNIINSDDTFVSVQESTQSLVKVKEAGIYRLMVNVRSFGSDLAQTSCSLLLNDTQIATIQTGGTDGQWVRQKLVKAELKQGFYCLELKGLKQGMEIEWVEFKRIS
ncbi:glycoside hydrolase family 3 protein [Anaerocolumna xylanovorans]|uniref:Beta-glucosidase n=1 Tax=Anaerocolumna xylanovorans DSM 12503 TaxID=1121345 RepID=A0A1M7XYX1_9FIRM|nr:glycoside hydrolase family 3 protein [Anaerocolumna xylanovorans]SHO44321.1 beta-glucosidase [Anaerocolumna xylanovorans DSM 12503]